MLIVVVAFGSCTWPMGILMAFSGAFVFTTPFTAGYPHLFEHLLAILHRHVQIENGQIRQLLSKCLHRRAAIVGQVDAMSIGLQTAAQELPQRFVVFGNE
jgi:hypothetical protein